MAKSITKVPDGPLIKKKGPFKGSTLKTGGKIPKAQYGKTWQQMSQGERGAKKTELIKKGGMERFSQYKDSVSTDASNRMNKAFEKNAAVRGMTLDELRADNKKPNIGLEGMMSGGPGKKAIGSSSTAPKSPCKGGKCIGENRNGGITKKAKVGAMIKRADGSMSRRGLYDNIRANKGSGKKPTKQMLVQEKKIKAKTKK